MPVNGVNVKGVCASVGDDDGDRQAQSTASIGCKFAIKTYVNGTKDSRLEPTHTERGKIGQKRDADAANATWKLSRFCDLLATAGCHTKLLETKDTSKTEI